jgi:hypothetical protein
MLFDFEQNATVEDLDTVPADFRSFYVEAADGSGFELRTDDTVSSAVKTIKGLYRTMTNQRKEVDRIRKDRVDLSPLSDFGSDPQSIRDEIDARIAELEEKSKSAGGTDVDVKAELDKLRQKLVAEHTTTLTGLQGELDTSRQQMRQMLIDTQISSALAGKAIDIDVAKRVYRDRFDMISDEETGKHRLVVKDEDGAILTNITDGSETTPEQFFAEQAKDERMAFLFKSEAPSGSGHEPRQSHTTRVMQKAKGDLSADDKIRMGLQKLSAGSR